MTNQLNITFNFYDYNTFNGTIETKQHKNMVLALMSSLQENKNTKGFKDLVAKHLICNFKAVKGDDFFTAVYADNQGMEKTLELPWIREEACKITGKDFKDTVKFFDSELKDALRNGPGKQVLENMVELYTKTLKIYLISIKPELVVNDKSYLLELLD